MPNVNKSYCLRIGPRFNANILGPIYQY